MSWSPVENTSVGIVRTRLSQNLRRNSGRIVVRVVAVVVARCGGRAKPRPPRRDARVMLVAGGLDGLDPRCSVVLVVLAHASPPRLLFSSYTFSSSSTARSRPRPRRRRTYPLRGCADGSPPAAC